MRLFFNLLLHIQIKTLFIGFCYSQPTLVVIGHNYYNRSMLTGSSFIYEMKGSQFPFGVLNYDSKDDKKILIKKRYSLRNPEQYPQIKLKLQKLKSISHKNTINLRSADQTSQFIDLYYAYVPLSLQDSFFDSPSHTVKQMHRQFIELAIYLAKNGILTTFSPCRCGTLVNESKTCLKYYLPLCDITLTNNRDMLERAVQLFNVQSMHYLDTLAQGLNNSTVLTIPDNTSQRTFKNRVKLFPNQQKKARRDSQPSRFQSKDSRIFSQLNKAQQIRKLSTLSRQLSEMSEIHKRHRASTRVSGDSFNTFKSILSQKNDQELKAREKNQQSSEVRNLLRRCLSSKGSYESVYEIDDLVARSRKAITQLKTLGERISSYKGVFNFIKTMHPCEH